jgi:hypothetical protein
VDDSVHSLKAYHNVNPFERIAALEPRHPPGWHHRGVRLRANLETLGHLSSGTGSSNQLWARSVYLKGRFFCYVIAADYQPDRTD